MDGDMSLDDEVRSIRDELVALMVRVSIVRDRAIDAEVDTIGSWWTTNLLTPMYQVRSRLEQLVDRDYDFTNITLNGDGR